MPTATTPGGREILTRRFANDLCECVCPRNHPDRLGCELRIGVRHQGAICQRCIDNIDGPSAYRDPYIVAAPDGR